ncbi:MAG: NAD(P)-dependent oxidoreductase [Candidatus Aenigmatarchaeota archaeon]
MLTFVTGGTGFIGKRLVKKLKEKGDDVIVFSRHEDKELSDIGVKFVIGNIIDKEDLRKAFPVDFVYHLAANLDESDPLMFDTNVSGTKNIVELSKEYGTKGIILLSSCGVLGNTKIADENSSYNPKTKYEKSKAEAEKIVINSGINYAIIRAPIIIGPNEIWLNIIKAAKNKYPIIGSGKNHFHLAYVDDVVDFMILARESKNALNQIFNIATPDIPTYKEVYKMICDELGIEMPRRHMPVFLIKLIASLHLISCKIKRKKPKLVFMKSSIDRLIRDRIVSIEKAKKLLGFVPKIDTHTALKYTIQYFKEKNML